MIIVLAAAEDRRMPVVVATFTGVWNAQLSKGVLEL
jgi:hypothetical protein